MGNWHYAQAGRQFGPVSIETLQGLAGSGQLQPTDLVWNETLPQWTPAGRIPEIFGAGQQQYQSPAAASSYTRAPDQLSYSAGTTMVSSRSADMLRQTKPWVRFLGIMAFIGSGLMILAGLLFAGLGASASRNPVFGPMAGMGGMMGAVYIGLGALYIVPGIFLNRYATHIGNTLSTGGAEDLERALEAQKSFWKFAGILTLVILSIYTLIFIFFMIAAMSR